MTSNDEHRRFAAGVTADTEKRRKVVVLGEGKTMTITDERLKEIVAGCEVRPVNCRFRLRDEGKPYPRSACEGCSGSFLSGFRHECLSSRTPTPATTRAMATELLAAREALAKANEREAEAKPQADPDGWIPWHGGENPVPGKRVEWEASCAIGQYASNMLMWDHIGGMADIIAYRVIEP